VFILFAKVTDAQRCDPEHNRSPHAISGLAIRLPTAYILGMKIFSSRLFKVLPLLVLSMSLSQCSCSDVMGSLFVSEADELRLGQQFDADIHNKSSKNYQATYTADASVQAYVQSVFDQVKAQIPSSEMPSYPLQKVQIIDAPKTVNAFAVPGGYIYVYTGLFTALRSENELAAVMAHEITHVVHHHYRNQLAESYGTQMLITMLTGDSGTVSKVVTSLFQLKYSRDDESDADANGTTLAGAASYNPLGVATFFSRMQTGLSVEVLSDHPTNSDRVKAVTAQINGNATLKALAYDAYGNTDINLYKVSQADFNTIKAKFP